MTDSFFEQLPTPLYGWALEMKEAEALCKKRKNRTPENFLRLAVAYRKLRMWKESKTAGNLGLVFAKEEEKEASSRLRVCVEVATEELKLKLESDFSKQVRALDKKDLTHDKIDWGIASNHIFYNGNSLQTAALTGDVNALEYLISRGASLNVTPLKPTEEMLRDCPYPDTSKALPMGCTALHLACVDLFYQKKQGVDTTGPMTCAMILVMMGADFFIPVDYDSAYSDPICTGVFRKLELGNKLTAKDMAKKAGNREVLQAMELMENEESAREHAWCRCGSRLPWKECHASPAVPGQSPHAAMDSRKGFNVAYRFSPKALCVCHVSGKKNHFDCCWMSATPFYLDDYVGGIFGPDTTFTLLGLEMFRTDDKEAKDTAKELVLEGGIIGYHERFLQDGMDLLSKSQLWDWDKEIAAGIIDHMDSSKFFVWLDVHWYLNKTELIKRCEDWDQAVESYCHDLGLTARAREETMAKYRANPLAPCGNPTCEQRETKIKAFMQCSACKCIAYCSRVCQKAHRKAHKQALCFRFKKVNIAKF